MFHQGEPRFRAWLTAYAGAQPRSARRLRDEIRRLSEQLAESESDRAARLEVIHRLQGESAERLAASHRIEAELDELRGHAIRLEAALRERESEAALRLDALEQLEADRRRLLDRISQLETALAGEREERERWLAVLPVLRLRLPGGSATARRVRTLRRRLFGGGPANDGASR